MAPLTPALPQQIVTQAEIEMPDGVIATDRINGWAGIARHLGCDVTTAIRWAREAGMPVHQPAGRRGWVYAERDELDAWSAASYRSEITVKEERKLRGQQAQRLPSSSSPSADAEAILPEPAEKSPDTAIQPGRSSLREAARWPRRTMAAGAFIVAGVFVVYSLFVPRRILFTGITQLTSDGTPKVGLVTDGSNLYFGEWHEGRIILSSVSVNGGPVRDIPTPFVQTEPVAVNSAGKQLLVLAGDGQEQERALWTVPVQGGPPQRVSTLLCHSAAWSPDGKEIVFASGNSIYLTTDNGTSQHLLQTFAGVPQDLRWSLDGKRLLLRLRDMTTSESTLWKLSLSDANRFRVGSLVPESPASSDYNTVSPLLDQQDDAFVGTDGPSSTIFALERSWLPWKPSPMLVTFARKIGRGSDFAVYRTAQQLYLLRGAPDQNELDWFDETSHEFRPFLPGISARDVDFSRDGRRIAYVRVRDNTLWVAAADGSSPRQIGTSAMINIELPRWSPDGKLIAFMGERSGAPFRIFVAPAKGGALWEASHGIDNQGAPTWSPDGRYLVYGRVLCQEERTCAIEQIDLKTGEQKMVPGSEGLSTARWSPDGRYIAALLSDKFQVFLLDREAGRWRKLADGVNGNDLAWAPDSRAVFASKPDGARPEIIRISLTDDKAVPAADLTSFSKLGGRIDTWFAVTPDDSILFLHIVSGHDIYALHYEEK